MSLRKQIFKLGELKRLLTNDNNCVSLVPTTRLIALPPLFLNDMKSGILYLLNSILKKYDRTLDGIIIGYQNIKVLMDDNTGIIPMGTAETEVNISVEFYIFQPKIGSHLEGVINKKSNIHIGCLVHRYFNATILKPEDVVYEDWLCRDFNVNDKIIFKVKDLDFTGLLPYIEGTLSENLLENIKLRKGVGDANDEMLGEMNKEDISSVIEAVGDDIQTGVENNKLKITLDNSLNKMVLCGRESDHGKQKKKKKKKEKDKKFAIQELDLVKRSVGEEMASGNDDRVTNHSLEKKKKKVKKKEKDKERNDDLDQGNRFEELSSLNSSVKTIECLGLWNDEDDSRNFVKPKKEKKKKKKEEGEELIHSNKETERLSLREEDNLLFSTQLEPNSGAKKMRMSFLSPIRAETTTETDRKQLLESLMNSVHDDLKGKKKKHKKRKRDEENEVEGLAPPKKPKMMASRSRMNGSSQHKSKSEEQEKEKTNKAKDEKKVEEGEGESIYEKLMKDAMSAISTSERKKKSKKDKSEREAKKRKRKGGEREGGSPPGRYRNGSMYDLDLTPEKRNPDKSLFTDSERSLSPVKRKEWVNGVSPDKISGEKKDKSKSLVQNMLDEFMKTEKQRLKTESDRDSGKESRKSQKLKQKRRESGSKGSPVDSLYAKLLKEAKVEINFNTLHEKSIADVGKQRTAYVKALF